MLSGKLRPHLCKTSVACRFLSRLFKPLEDDIQRSSDSYIKLMKKNEKLVADYNKLLGVIKGGGGPKAVERHLKQGKMLVRERINQLLDEDSSFLELSAVAGIGMPYGDIPCAGVITGFGKVHDRYVMVIANDGSVKGGTVFPVTLKKQLRAQQIAQELSIPCVYIVDSGGAFLPLQAEIFIEGGKVFNNEAVMSSLGIPQIAVVCGMCTAGGAYVPTMADEAIMVHKTGTIFLGGPPLVKAALGEIVSAEELGGATMHSKISGCVDHFATDEKESYEICRDVILSLNLPQIPVSDCQQDSLYDINDLNGLVNSDRPTTYQVISRLCDGSGFQEFKKLYGPSLITGTAHINGNMVGLIADAAVSIHSSDAYTKATHFVQLCTQRQLPILFLTNRADCQHMTSGEQLKIEAQFMKAVACSDVPKITIITGGFHGVQAYSMGSKAFGANLVFNWPISTFGMQGTKAMTAEIQYTHPNTDMDSFTRKTSSIHAAANLWTDGIILPHHTRQVISDVLDIINYSTTMKSFIEKSQRDLMQSYYRL